MPTFVIPNGALAERLGTGLQNLLQRFDSARHLLNSPSDSEGLFLLLCFPACVLAREMFTAWEVEEKFTAWEVAEMFTGWETAETFTGNRAALDSISILEQPENGFIPQVIVRQPIMQITELQVTSFFL